MTHPLLLRPITLHDLDHITTLDTRAFGPAGWSRQHFEGEITQSPISILYLLTQHTQPTDHTQPPLAYFGTWHILDQLHLCTFAVDPPLHRHGLGALLLACVFRLAQRLQSQTIQLEVRQSNHPARHLYRRHGFTEQTTRPNLYTQPTEHGILMHAHTPKHLPQQLQPPAAQHWNQGLHLHWNDRAGNQSEHWPAPTQPPH